MMSLFEFLTIGIMILGCLWAVSGCLQKSAAIRVVSDLLSEPIVNQRDLSMKNGQRVTYRKSIDRIRLVWWMLGACLLVCLRSFAPTPTTLDLTVSGMVGGLIAELLYRKRTKTKNQKRLKKIEFETPLVMERLVMAVSAGLDILPALAEVSSQVSDDVSKLLAQVVSLSENGMTIEAALSEVSSSVDSNVIKHAFTHIALAHREGGELVRPIRELSDATQLAYQECIEEEIARLPVKAVLPLVITFSGLLIGFITIPLVQVSGLTSKVSQGEFLSE